MLRNTNARKQLEKQLRGHLAAMEKYHMVERIVEHESKQVDIVLERIEKYNKTVSKRERLDPNVILKSIISVASLMLLFDFERGNGIMSKGFQMIDKIKP